MPNEDTLIFQPIDTDSMEDIFPFLTFHKERSCDFSYGGLLMWVEMFNYEYAIYKETLFIKGRTPGDGEKTEKDVAFSIPLGPLTLKESVEILKDWCANKGVSLIFSAVPPEGAEALLELGAKEVKELPSWEDYIYDAETLASLTGKKLSKKRNHVNQFKKNYPTWQFRLMTPADIPTIREDFNHTVEKEASQSEEAKNERKLANKLIGEIERGNQHLIGGVLLKDDEIVAYTIGDIIGDTLYIHVEKAERTIAGSFEMINQCFAQEIVKRYPEIKYINREDDAGDPGLRYAKQTYHPLYLLKKFNVIF